MEGIPTPDIPNFDPKWDEKTFLRCDLMPKIFEHFDNQGVEYFEGLRIWHIPQLREEFVKRAGRQPNTQFND